CGVIGGETVAVDTPVAILCAVQQKRLVEVFEIALIDAQVLVEVVLRHHQPVGYMAVDILLGDGIDYRLILFPS
ncbi:MAG: hypothetical protein J7M40_10695, partial [Planctomycetes bacterium]|nr:hypothetical protein [Planctomycetota bacterium]